MCGWVPVERHGFFSMAYGLVAYCMSMSLVWCVRHFLSAVMVTECTWWLNAHALLCCSTTVHALQSGAWEVFIM